MSPFRKIAIVGSGNVANTYTKILKNNGICPEYILIRDEGRIEEIKESFGVEAIVDYGKLSECDLVIIAVNDDAIGEVASRLSGFKGLLVHTSGTQASHILNVVDNYGVIYPLQTLTKNYDVDFKSVPLLINASSEENKDRLRMLAEKMSGVVMECSDEERRYLHMSAVFVCNFVNLMLQIGGKLLGDKNINISVFEPLVRETVNKAFAMGPENALTGPAVRGDRETIKKHLAMLDDYSDEKKIYELLTDYIINKYSKNEKL